MKEDLTIELIEIMFNIFRKMKNEMSYTNKLIHLSQLQIQALVFLKQNNNAQMREIAKHFRIELPSATSLMNKLHNMKLVIRRSDPEDRRAVRMSLTDKGTKLLTHAVTQRKNKLEKILSYLSDTEKHELLQILKTLHNKLIK